MINPRLLLCSGVELPKKDPLREGRTVVELDSLGHKANVHVRLEDVARVLQRNISPRLADLLEIASYVYTADTATSRGQEWSNDGTTEAWDRDFLFVIPVRDEAFWNSDIVKDYLVQVLSFLSNDKFDFVFPKLKKDRVLQEYFEFGDRDDWAFYGAPRALMFSGGLDSLAGATVTAVNGEDLLLVSHRPVSTLSSRQRTLFEELAKTFPSSRMIHVPVWINKAGKFGREYTQRTRSFLYSALGAVIAESTNAGGVRFFENGVVSLNLPVADEVQRARASRTTHPISLDLFSKLYSLVTDRELVVDNPFIFKTKTEIVSLIKNNGGSHLIEHTCSCVHTGHFQSSSQWHCGTCSQCIDRRIAILAAGVQEFDRETDYVSDVFVGPRKEGYEFNMAVDYARHATELNRMSDQEFLSRFNTELTRAARPFEKRSEAARQLIEMHNRHGGSVCRVISDQLKSNADNLINQSLEKTSMLALVAGQQHFASTWKRYADRLVGLLNVGLPIICKDEKPESEPKLQVICDGILQGHDADLQREFPFMRWSGSATKPDWSKEGLSLWIELKYVRKKIDVARITRDIAEDITKYGDNDRNVAFVIYDPGHFITKEDQFSAPIIKRAHMLVYFIR